MAGRYEETKAEIDDSTERVRTLVSEGNNDAAEALTAETEKLIGSLPKNQQKRYREALEEAGTPPKVHTLEPVGPTPWQKIDGVFALLEETARHMADGVRAQMEGAKPARRMAEGALQMRLRIPNPAGLPDLKCTSQEGRNAQSAMYARAGEQVEGDPAEVEIALGRLANNVRDEMANVLPTYIRSLDDNREEAARYFPMALKAYPDETPSEAVYRTYYDNGYELSRYTHLEKVRMRRQLKKAKSSGEEPKVRELEEALGVRTENNPEETLSTSFEKLQRNLKKVETALPDALEDLSEEKRKQLRVAAEDVIDRAKHIVSETL